MKIEEVIKIYEFLGNLDLIGFIALCILLTIGILAVFIPLKEKMLISSSFIGTTLCFVIAALIMLYIQAQIRVTYLQVGNFIKQDFIFSDFKQKSFADIKLPNTNDDDKKKAFLLKLVHKYPDEFIIVKLKGQCELQQIAIALVDTKATEKIDKQINEKAKRTAHLLSSIMLNRNIDKIYIKHDFNNPHRLSLDSIDNKGFLIADEFFEALIGIDNLTPIYDKDNAIIAFTIPKNIKEGSLVPPPPNGSKQGN